MLSARMVLAYDELTQMWTTEVVVHGRTSRVAAPTISEAITGVTEVIRDAFAVMITRRRDGLDIADRVPVAYRTPSGPQ